MYVPPGFTTVTPYFFVANAESFVRFLVQGLGGTARDGGQLVVVSDSYFYESNLAPEIAGAL